MTASDKVNKTVPLSEDVFFLGWGGLGEEFVGPKLFSGTGCRATKQQSKLF